MFEGAVDPYEWYYVPVREEVVCVCFPVESLGVVLVVVSVKVVSASAVTHHTDPIAVEADVTSIGLDSDVLVSEATLPHIRKTTAVHSAIPDVLQIVWCQPTARPWEGWSKSLS